MKKETHISFHDQIARNKRKSVFLIIIIFAVLIAITYVIGLIYKAVYQGSIFIVLILGIIISISYILITYYNSDKIALASVGAKLASREEHRQYYHSVEGLCLASGLPMPRLYIISGEQINAFATGRNPEHSVIAVTSGALKKLDKQELEGVIGHELSHIANYDIKFMTLVAVMVGMIAIISEIFLRSLWFRGNDNKKGNIAILLIGIALAILAPIVVMLVQLAISRKREYAADASSVKFTRYPKGLINALKKIESEHINEQDKKRINKAVAPLFISDPFKKKVQGLTSTHPSIESRIKALERM